MFAFNLSKSHPLYAALTEFQNAALAYSPTISTTITTTTTTAAPATAAAATAASTITAIPVATDTKDIDDENTSGAIILKCIAEIQTCCAKAKTFEQLLELISIPIEAARKKLVIFNDGTNHNDQNERQIFIKLHDFQIALHMFVQIENNKGTGRSYVKLEEILNVFFALLIEEELSNKQIIAGLMHLPKWCFQFGNYHRHTGLLDVDYILNFIEALLPNDVNKLKKILIALERIKTSGTGEDAYWHAMLTKLIELTLDPKHKQSTNPKDLAETRKHVERAVAFKSLTIKFTCRKEQVLIGKLTLLQQLANLLIEHKEIPFQPITSNPDHIPEDNAAANGLPTDAQIEVQKAIYKVICAHEPKDAKSSTATNAAPVIALLKTCDNENLKFSVTRAYITAYLLCGTTAVITQHVRSIVRFAWQTEPTNDVKIIQKIHDANPTLITNIILNFIAGEVTLNNYVAAIKLLLDLGENRICKTLTRHKASELATRERFIRDSFATYKYRIDNSATQLDFSIALPEDDYEFIAHLELQRVLRTFSFIDSVVFATILSYMPYTHNDKKHTANFVRQAVTWLSSSAHIELLNPITVNSLLANGNSHVSSAGNQYFLNHFNQPTNIARKININIPQYDIFFLFGIANWPNYSWPELEKFILKLVDYLHWYFNRRVSMWLEDNNMHLPANDRATAAQLKIPFFVNFLNTVIAINDLNDQLRIEQKQTIAVAKLVIAEICKSLMDGEPKHYLLYAKIEMVLKKLKDSQAVAAVVDGVKAPTATATALVAVARTGGITITANQGRPPVAPTQTNANTMATVTTSTSTTPIVTK